MSKPACEAHRGKNRYQCHNCAVEEGRAAMLTAVLQELDGSDLLSGVQAEKITDHLERKFG
jgi:hypothetical protein